MDSLLLIYFVLFSVLSNCCSSQICEYLEDTAQDVITKSCFDQMHTVCQDGSLAWKLFDASSKFFTSGMTYTNVMDYGNFPECLSIDHTASNGQRIIGKYCGMGMIIVNIFLTPQTMDILQNSNIDINATGPHVISAEKFSELDLQLRDVLIPDIPYVLSKYSVCVPDACTPREVGIFYLFGYLEQVNLIIFTDLPCETKYSNTDFKAGDIAFITVLAIILLLIILSTTYDSLLRYEETKNLVPKVSKKYQPLMLSFSILYNGEKLLYISNNKTEQIQCFHGIRFISMMWVVAFHAIIPLQTGIMPMENYPESYNWGYRWTNRYILSALLAVDTFFFMSGCLLAFTYLKKESQTSALDQILKVPNMYFHRYLRLTPSVAAMYLTTITIYRKLGSGPLWTFITTSISDTCKKYWWQFFLYIQNYTNPDELCVVPTWYLSADMQMFILAPIVFIPTALYAKKALRPLMYGLSALTILCIIIPMITRYFIDEGEGNTYATHERFTDFMIGFIFGIVMRLYKEKPFIFSQLVNFLLWILSIAVGLTVVFYWHDVDINYSLIKYTLFMGFYRPIWCLALAFMVYSCYHNQGGIIQWILTRSCFQILGRLSYSMYVLHMIVELYAGGIFSNLTSFDDYSLFYKWCGHIIVTMIVSVIWVLAFEYPILTIEKYITFDWLKTGSKTRKTNGKLNL